MGKKRGVYYAPDPVFLVVKTRMGRKEEAVHSRAVMDLVSAIYCRITQVVNYDHVEMTIPRFDIPLTSGKKRYDIVYLDRDNNRVLIEVKICKKQK